MKAVEPLPDRPQHLRVVSRYQVAIGEQPGSGDLLGARRPRPGVAEYIANAAHDIVGSGHPADAHAGRRERLGDRVDVDRVRRHLRA